MHKLDFTHSAMLLLAMAVLAGCAAPSTTTTTNSTTTQSNPELEAPRHLVLTNCTAWAASELFPGSTGPGKPPPGWTEPSAATPLTGVDVDAYHCQRLSVGPFERGPINILFDSHTHAEFPVNCTASSDSSGDRIVVGVLNSFWLDDPEVASYLNATFGLPVMTTQFKETDQPQGVPMGSHTWTWGLSGQPSSQMTIYDDGTSAPPFPSRDRIFWPYHGGMASLEFQYDRRGPAGPVSNRYATGTLAPPMLFAQLPGGQYAGPGQWYPEMQQADGTFIAYTDPNCQHPV